MRTQREFLEDIIEYGQTLQSFVSDIDFETFSRDKKTNFAAIRAFEVIGEAVKNLDDTLTSQYPEINWRGFAGFRDILAHAYHRVNLIFVWDAIFYDLPKLLSAIKRLLDDETIE